MIRAHSEIGPRLGLKVDECGDADEGEKRAIFVACFRGTLYLIISATSPRMPVNRTRTKARKTSGIKTSLF